MKREEAIAILQDKHDECKAFYDLAAHPEDAYPGTKEYMEALQMALADLRVPTQEQLEKSWAGCEYCEKHKINLVRIEMNYNDSPGSPERLNPTRVPKFCPMCGRPLTDEAVEITLRRLEALHENNR